MKLRTRIALLLDPNLIAIAEERPPETDGFRLDWSYAPLRDVVEELHRLNAHMEALRRIRSRPRIIDCKHPELHSNDELAAGSIR